MQQAQRTAEHIEAAVTDPQRLVDAIRCAHLAFMAGLTEALSGSAGIGAFKDKLAGEHLKFLRGERADMPSEHTLHFAELFEWAQDPDRMEWGAIPFTEDEKQAAAELDGLRGLIDHPKPTHWSVEPGQLVKVLGFVPKLLEKCVAAAFHHYVDGDGETVQVAAARMSAGLSRVSRPSLADQG
ncbi:hypothetical protein [Phenylobacterium kunshanense]|uniref:hypothetical protein n=1 Tax=Phenylobacterium kunshanense TaxID=1445034 RepID=UPI001057FFFF|nr:hypothetical protein [Phenylobacterium kunshanense]